MNSSYIHYVCSAFKSQNDDDDDDDDDNNDSVANGNHRK